MAQFHIPTHAVAAQVKKAIFHAQIISAVGLIFYGKWRRKALIEHHQFIDDYFYIACGDLVVFAEALVHAACHLQYIFASQLVRALTQGGVCLGVEY